MRLPELTTIENQNNPAIESIANSMGLSFLEEPWTKEWLSALETIEATKQRKIEISKASMRYSLLTFASHKALHILPDQAGASCSYRASEIGNLTGADLEEQAMERLFADFLTVTERDALLAKAKDMYEISDLTWHKKRSAENDFIHLALIAIDSQKRGTGAFRRLLTPFLNYADRESLTCYLECYSEKLEQLYGHFGFTTVEKRTNPRYEIEELCMERRPL